MIFFGDIYFLTRVFGEFLQFLVYYTGLLYGAYYMNIGGQKTTSTTTTVSRDFRPSVFPPRSPDSWAKAVSNIL
jgi:hypothetical protein